MDCRAWVRLALVVAVVGPLLQLSGVITPLPVLQADWIQIAGIALAVLGIVLTVWAQLDMGDSWRVGVDESEMTPLVHSGMFGRVRNPIYTAMLTFDLGIALLTPNFVTFAGLTLALSRSSCRCAESRNRTCWADTMRPIVGTRAVSVGSSPELGCSVSLSRAARRERSPGRRRFGVRRRCGSSARDSGWARAGSRRSDAANRPRTQDG